MRQATRNVLPDIYSSLPRLRSYEIRVWQAMLAIYVVGDMVSTVVSLELGGTESTIFIANLLPEYGYGVLLAHKLGMVALIGVIWYLPTIPAQLLDVDPAPYRSVLVSMFLLRGVYLLAWNSYVVYLLLTVDSPVATPPF